MKNLPLVEGHPTKRCSICDELIGVNAKKCVHCDSYFGARRYFSFGNATLALLTSLIAVFGSLFPPIYREFIQSKNSDITITYAGNSLDEANDRDVVSFVASNDGQRSGSISSAAIIIDMKKTRLDDDGSSLNVYLVPLDGRPVIVAPQQTVLVPMAIDYARRDQKEAYDRFINLNSKKFEVGHCSFQVNVVNFYGISEKRQIQMDGSTQEIDQNCEPSLTRMKYFLLGRESVILR